MSMQELILDQTYKIHWDQPLREYSRDHVLAFNCTNQNNPDREHIAYITSHRHPPRLSLYHSSYFSKLSLSQKWVYLDRIETSHCPSIPTPSSGPADFQQNEQDYRYIFIVENQTNHVRHTPKLEYNEALKKYSIPSFEPITNKEHLLKITHSIFRNLLELNEYRVFHGSIRPDTLFFNPTASYFSRLGECFLTSPGYEQPALYESVGRAICSPYAKGEGNFQDDLYAFGVSLLTLYLGHEPFEKLNETDIIHEKLKYGSSYLAFTKDLKLPNYLQEILQGILQDDHEMQWGPEEIRSWTEGQHVRVKKAHKQIVGSRSIRFAGKKYKNLRHLAFGMMQIPEEAQSFIKNDSFLKWLNHAFSENTILSNLTHHLETCKKENLSGHYCLSIALMILSNENPLFFDGCKIGPNGMSGFILEATFNPALKQKLITMIELQLPLYWLGYQTKKVQNQFSDTEQFKKILKNRHIGQGFEYILYKNNPDLYCLSPLIAYRKASSVKELLQAIDNHARAHPSYEALPIDKHIMAFLCVKKINLIQAELPKLENYKKQIAYLTALINIYSALQNITNIENLTGLSAWFSFHLRAHLKKLKDKKKAHMLLKKIDQYAELGRLDRCLPFFNEEIFKKDTEDFKKAKERYSYIQKEIENNRLFIESPISIKKTFGRPLAAYFSIFTSVIFLISSFIYFMTI